jgi:hypothetical protein
MEREVGELKNSAPADLVGRGSGITHHFEQGRLLILAAGLQVLKPAEPLHVLLQGSKRLGSATWSCDEDLAQDQLLRKRLTVVREPRPTKKGSGCVTTLTRRAH